GVVDSSPLSDTPRPGNAKFKKLTPVPVDCYTTAMRNNKNEYEKCLFLGTEHRKNMRNANF
ncbi:hypothetical protein PL498_18880, partial [Bacteroides xylanisolvens]|uniref:hypothetical protein n=1 Tax=Bacteroides xylanisolvens TaxID=371601 RepID=UPI00230711C8